MSAFDINVVLKNFGIEFLMGATAGAISRTLTAPIERIKILSQLEKGKAVSMLTVLRRVLSEEGALALFNGNVANVYRVSVTYAMKFASYDYSKSLIRGADSNRKLSKLELVNVGIIAGLIQASTTYPLEVVRTRMTMPRNSVEASKIPKSFFGYTKFMIQTEGFGSLFRGFVPNLIAGVPYTAIQMSAYDMIREIPYFKDSSFFPGALAALVAQTVAYPGDTIRRRMQVDGMGNTPRVYKSMTHCITTIYQKEGLRGYVKGSVANTVRALPAAAIQFYVYQYLKDNFRKPVKSE